MNEADEVVDEAILEEGAFRTFLRDVRSAVDARLVTLLAAKTAAASENGPYASFMVEAVRDLTMRGGKRFRPALALAAFRACDGDPTNEESVLAAGVALELLQTYLLMHDDWMDGDDTRRGGPSAHAWLTRQLGSADKGAASAILAGDYASALAQEQLAAAGGEPACVVEALRLFASVQQDAIYGQQLDLSGQSKDVERMHALKTGSYTVRGPLRFGALFARANESDLRTLDAYAEPLGVAFQLRDDLLGAFGQEHETGKPRGGDVRAGKLTALIAELDASHGVDARAMLGRAFGDARASEEDVARVLSTLEKCGARGAVEQRLAVLVDRAKQALRETTLRPEGVTLLKGAATALTVRRV